MSTQGIQRLPLGLWLVIGTLTSVHAATPKIRIEHSGSNVLVHFDGTLQGASRLEGPYQPVTGAASPFHPATSDAQTFWRAQLPGMSTIAAGFYHTAAIRADGTLWAWGTNSFGQLGDGTLASAITPRQIGSNSNWAGVTAGDYHTVALRSDGTLWSWGNNELGRLGIGTFGGVVNVPRQVGTATNWQVAAAGRYHTVALREDGSLWVWGGNPEGELGNGSYASTNAPQQIEPAWTWRAVGAGWYHTAAVRSDGTLWTWGDNREGQMGNGTFTGDFSHGFTTPQQVGSNVNWQAASAHGDYTLALRDDGSLWAWGANYNGQVGNGSIGRMVWPQQIGSSLNWEIIVAGMTHSGALARGGELWDWGANYVGQLGVGLATTNPPFALTTPQRLGGDATWRSVAIGYQHTVALRADGTLWTWGLNSSGQVGDGTTTNRVSPVQVPGGASWGPARR